MFPFFWHTGIHIRIYAHMIKEWWICLSVSPEFPHLGTSPAQCNFLRHHLPYDVFYYRADELLLVVVVLHLSVVPRGQAIGLLATKGIPLRIAADREKGRASWCQVGLPAQSLPRRRFRRALCAFICTICMRVCIYVYVCMCADMYIYMYVHVCMYMYMYAFIHVCMCMCMHICA